MVSNGSPNPGRRTTPARGGGGSRTQPSTPKRRGGTMSSSSSATPTTTGTRIINSPLIDAPPTPTPDASKERLIRHDDRWRAMSQLAGSHRQSARLLDLSNRSLPPEALKYGVPPKTAGMVTELRYDGNLVGKDELPSFLDIVVPLFPRLQHITLRNNPCCPASKSRAMENDDADGDDEEPIPNIDPKLKKKLDAAVEAADREQVRMQRLYIIYRLPDLVSIDGISITKTERHLARPLTPVGTPVKKNEWLTKAMATVRVDVGIGVSDGYDSASSDGAKAGVRGASKAEKDQGDTCSEIVPSETGGTTMSAVEVSLSGLANYVRTEHKDLIAETSSSSDSASSYDAGGCKGASTKPNLKAVTLVRTNRSLPPPSPASRLRTFPVPRQKKRRSGSASSTSKSSAAARQLWRQRNKNVASMVDNESDEEITDEEEELEKGIPAAAAGAAGEASKKSNDQDEEALSSADWSGTMGTISNMED